MTNFFNGHVTLWFAVPHHRGQHAANFGSFRSLWFVVPHHRGQHAANFGSFRSCGSGVKTFLICHVS